MSWADAFRTLFPKTWRLLVIVLSLMIALDLGGARSLFLSWTQTRAEATAEWMKGVVESVSPANVFPTESPSRPTRPRDRQQGSPKKKEVNAEVRGQEGPEK